MWPYQRPPPPYRWGSGGPTVPSVAGEHGPAGHFPSRTAPGTHRAPHAVARTHTRDGAREQREWGGCVAALCAAAGGARSSCTRPMLADAAGPSTEADAAVLRPTAAAMAQSATTAAASAALGGGLVAACSPAGTTSRLAHVSGGISTRLAQRAARRGRVSEG